jgi:CHAT domain-containing protein
MAVVLPRTLLGLALCLIASVGSAAQPAQQPPGPTPAELTLAQQIAKADADGQRALIEERRAELSPGLIQALIDTATKQRQDADLRGSLATLGAAGTIAERLGRPRDVARALNHSSLVLSNLGRLAEARDYVLRSRVRFAEAGDRESEVRCIINLGILSRMNGNLDAALAHYDEAASLAAAGKFTRLTVVAHNNRAVVYLQRDDLRRALVELEAARTLHRDEDQLLADIISNIGLVHVLQGSTLLGIDYVERAIALQQRLGNRFSTINEYANLAPAYLTLKRTDDALAAGRRAVEYAEKAGARELGARAWNQYGAVLHRVGRLDEAADAFLRSAQLARDGDDKDALATALTQLSRVRSDQQRYEAALEAAHDATRALAGIGSVRKETAVGHAFGDALRGLGRADEAADAYGRSIAALERWRDQVAGDETDRERFFESKLGVYHAIVDLLVARGRPAEALGYAERARSRALLDVLQRGRLQIVGRMTDAERGEEAALEQRVAAATAASSRRDANGSNGGSEDEPARALRQARETLDEFRTKLYSQRPDVRFARGLLPTAGADRLGAIVDASTAVLFYVVTDKRTFAFVVTQAAGAGAPRVDVRTIEVSAEALADRVARFRERLGARDLGIATEARALHALLVEPVSALVGARSRWVLAPDGPLWQLPFQALRTAAGRDVVDIATLEYTPSLTALVELRGRLATRGVARPLDLAVFGASSTETGGSLPDAERQVRAIARLYPPAKTAVYVGASARESRAREEAARARVLHIAAHGEVDDASPLYSRLLLAGSESAGAADDGRLEARELINYDVGADLVVLSACETGLGRIGAGEGVIGLSWAALVAGAANVAVSLWRVDAASTGELMTAMHRQLSGAAASRDDPASALRAAALAVRRDPRYRHPFYWAGFVLVGGGRVAASR